MSGTRLIDPFASTHRGQSTLGSVHVDAEGGKWSLCLYPNGDNLSREGQLGVFVKVDRFGGW